MTTGRYARIAARVLARGLDAEPAPPSPEARREAIEAVAHAIRVRARRRARMWWVAFGSIAAAALWAAGGGYALLSHDVAAGPASAGAVRVVVHPSGRGAVVLDHGGATPLREGGDLERGARVVAREDGRALLALSTGTRLLVEEGGDLAVVDRGPSQRFALRAGAVRADVARLSRGERFVIRTPDAEVEVHGTSFRVSVVPARADCGAGARTRVEVLDGVVTVRHAGSTVRLRAGERWPVDCAELTAAAQSSQTPPPLPAHDPPARATGAARTTGPARAAGSDAGSALAAENDLFAEAVALRRAGQSARAIDAFDRFLARYPRGRLAESAAASRLRLLRASGSPRSVEAARRYLSTYPRGFARDEAQEMLEGP